MNSKYHRKSPHILNEGGEGVPMKFAAFKNVLLGCLFLLVFLAAPVQSQTPTPFPCGQTATLTAGTTYALSADCDSAATIIRVDSGTVTLNGNGFAIRGAPNDPVIDIRGASTVFNLNDITFSGSGATDGRIVTVHFAATLNARNVIFSGNAGMSLAVHHGDTTVTLTNVQFLNNGPASSAAREGSAMYVWGAATSTTVTINGATFIGNSGERPSPIRVNIGILNLNGCIRASGNTGVGGAAAPLITTDETGNTVNDNRGSCPSKKKKEKTPTPTATPRPQAVTCPALSQATGIVIHAAYGLDSGIQCQRLDGGGIGVQALAENYIAAVDIWGYVEQDVEVCFPQAGRIIFLDAAMIPRSMTLMQTHIAGDNMTCALIETAGSLVLLPPE